MKLGITSKIGFLAFMLILLTAGIIGFVEYKATSALLIQHEIESTENVLYREGVKIQSAIDTLREDVMLLAGTPPIQGIIRARKNRGIDPKDGSTGVEWRDRLALIFIEFLKIKSNYTVVVFIGTADHGREIVRVHREEGAIEIVPADQLQVKEHRPYFQKTVKLQKGEYYLSEVNLQQEKGRVSEPHTPMLRVAVPIYTNEGKIFGFIKINLSMEPLLQSLLHAKEIEHRHYVVNDRGEFLLHPDSSMTFGFDLGTRHTVQDVFPELNPLFSPDSKTNTLTTFSEAGAERQLVSLHKIHFDPLRPWRFIGIMDSTLHSHVIAESKAIRNRSIGFALVLVAFGLMTVLFFSRLITRPLRRITQSVDAISSGAAHISLPIDSSDEIGSLARSFATMVAKQKSDKKALQEAHDQLEARVRVRTAELERSNKDLEDFASIASHDLREPLRKIVNFGDRLTDTESNLTSQGKDYLKRMQNASLRMNRLIDDLLNYSRVTSKPGSFESIDLKKVVDQTVEDLEMKISEERGTVVVGEMPTLEADLFQMRQLFLNLIGNSLKYHREGVPPVVAVKSAKNGDGTWVIRVEDNGIGFDEKYAERIFKIFERLHGRGAYEGTGVGLAICEKIVTRHKGTIRTESTLGEGITFIITLPEKQPL